jgi:serine/threonine protein kinase
VFFFTLEVENGELTSVELEQNDDLHENAARLVPRMTVPKYVRNMKVPWISSREVRVVNKSHIPPPINPAKVKVGDEIRFFKPVDVAQPSTTKRELKILAKIEKLGLHEKLRVPTLQGPVGFANSRTDISGFLLESIDGSILLTKKLDARIPAPLRKKWSRETESKVKILHDSGIVWGDAEAHNTLVDENDDL